MLRLPPKQTCKLLDIDQIVRPRRKDRHTVEKMQLLLDLRRTLLHRLKVLEKYGKIRRFSVEKHKDYLHRKKREAQLRAEGCPEQDIARLARIPEPTRVTSEVDEVEEEQTTETKSAPEMKLKPDSKKIKKTKEPVIIVIDKKRLKKEKKSRKSRKK